MTEDDFWDVIGTARAATGDADDTQGESLAEAIVAMLVDRPAEESIEFQAHFDAALVTLYRWDVWGAAYLIGGGCSDDSFMDFRAGVIGLGRKWYERVLAEPDSLASYPAVVGAADIGYDGAIFAEAVLYAATTAFEQITGDDEAFESDPRVLHAPVDDPDALGEPWDFDDEDEMSRHLPRLAALFLYSDDVD